MAFYVNGIVAVNGGKVTSFKTEEFTGEVEVLGPNTSKHVVNMVVAYAMDGNIKVSIAYDGKNFYVYRFRSRDDLHHYWSRKLSSNEAINSNKYGIIARYCVEAYKSIFNK